jgi:hypothetical protein
MVDLIYVECPIGVSSLYYYNHVIVRTNNLHPPPLDPRDVGCTQYGGLYRAQSLEGYSRHVGCTQYAVDRKPVMRLRHPITVLK